MQQNHNKSHSGEFVVAKYNYVAQENHELSIVKNERLRLLDDSCLWWKVKRIDTEEIGYIPSNFARREKRSFIDKIISRRIQKKFHSNNNNSYQERIFPLALVKFQYEAESEDEITLNKGIWVTVLDKKSDGWWFVQYDKKQGWYPSNYLIEKTSNGLNSLSLFNQLKYQHSSSSSSTNGLSSSSSANSNIIDTHQSHFISSNRHNSHPTHINSDNDEYAFVIKHSKFAHSDGKLDSCSTPLNQKNNSWSPLTPDDTNNSEHTSSSLLNQQTMLLTHSESQSPYDHECWYYGSISREEAEMYLKSNEVQRGDFLIRNSERKIGHFSLSIRDDNELIRHFRIEQSNDARKFLIGKRSFLSLYDLIEHYKTHPVFDDDHDSKLYLNQPLTIKYSNH